MEFDDIKLEPLRFLKDTVEAPWGTADYLLADLGVIDSMAAEGFLGGNTISDIMETYLERISGEAAFDQYGTQFPVMVKTLDIKGKTSLHVNPDDVVAAQRYDSLGKTALWYVVDATPESRLYLGFRRDTEASEFYAKCQDGTVDTLLKEVKPVKGQAYLIPPGTVHAAKGVKLLEIAECSELWFRLHEWEPSEREIHLEEAFDLIDFNAAGSLLVELPVSVPQLKVRKLQIDVPSRVESPEGDCFKLYVCLEGTLDVDGITASAQGAVLVPADILGWTLTPGKGGATVLEVSVGTFKNAEQWEKSE